MPPEASLDFGHPFPLPQIARMLRLCLRFPSTNTSVRAAEESSLSYTKNSGRTNGKELSLHVANTTLLQGFSPISKRMQTGSREECKPAPSFSRRKQKKQITPRIYNPPGSLILKISSQITSMLVFCLFSPGDGRQAIVFCSLLSLEVTT